MSEQASGVRWGELAATAGIALAVVGLVIVLNRSGVLDRVLAKSPPGGTS